MSKKHILQHIIFTNNLVCDEENMYVRADDGVLLAKDKIIFEKNTTCNFSTYFNSFSVNKWKEYTIIDNLQLALLLKGDFCIEIFSAYWYMGEVRKECVFEKEISSDGTEEVIVDLPTDTGDNLFLSITSLSREGCFYGGYFSTSLNSDEELCPVEIDLVICTFRREDYVKRNINLLREHFGSGDKYNATGHLRIKVVDNGCTLTAKELDLGDGFVSVYQNINAGGSGGFSRGIIESLKEGKATHVLLMDDDVLVQVEALERTYSLLRILKKDYQGAFLGGAMLRLDKKNIQHENLAGYRGLGALVSLKRDKDLNKYSNVLFNEKFEDMQGVYCAWWYCCMPVCRLGLNNLPLPFFVRMDDMEYSLRNMEKHMSLNGISVWHAPFDLKYSTLMENYFMFRNSLVVDSIHLNIPCLSVVRRFGRKFIRDLFCYDYGGAELILDAMESFLHGPSFFENVDVAEDLKTHGIKQIKMRPLQDFNTDREFLYEDFCSDLLNTKESIVTKLFRFVTLNGHLLPNWGFKSVRYAEYGYSSNSRHFFRCKKVIGCDLNFSCGADFQIDRKKCFQLISRYIALNLSLFRSFENTRESYKNSLPYLSSLVFWEKYLKLKK